ncbi:MAG: nicotinate-nucleotide adenylyltransferase [Acidobacteria bacterium]|nr:nicotinate-nucleotide adenylyltransferase [Acidobacteriota bacterium]
MQRRKRIALYGGTFDPVHAGHLSVARKLLKLFALDQVLFIPAHVAPHKRNSAVTPPLHRYAMLALATQSEAALRISSIELDAPERPYTVETLARLQAEADETAQFFFVMGADSWAEVTTWREWERLLTMTSHIVVTRPGYELAMSHVTEGLRERISDVRGLEPEELARRVDAESGEKIYVTDAVFVDISATQIRQSIREGNQVWLSHVPEAVADYIEKYRLYRRDL